MIKILDYKINNIYKLILTVMFSFVFLLFALLYTEENLFSMTNFKQRLILLILFQILYFITVYIMSFFSENNRIVEILFINFIVGAGLILRISCIDFTSGDYINFLKIWVLHYRDNGGIFAIKDNLGDYNVVYLYFLAFFSYFKINDLYLIKYLSIIFDMILAIYCSFLIGHIVKNRAKELMVFVIIIFFPTVWLNSAYWGQCDSTYAAFCVMGLYYALKNKPRLSLILFTLAICFKLQSIFLYPIIIILYITKKIKFEDFLMMPLTYFITILPAILLGKPISDIIFVYSNQTKTYSDYLNLNSPSAYNFLGGIPNYEIMKKVGIYTAFAVVGLIIYICYAYKHKIDDKFLILISLLFVAIIPWLLPSMHDRYFYLADIFSILVALIFTEIFYLPIFTLLGSYSGYHAYLMGAYIFELKYASIFILITIIIVISKIKYFLKSDKLIL